MVDADGADTLLIPNVAAERGAILSNHRSFGDFAFDPCQAHAPVMSRYAAIAATGLSGLLGILSNRIIAIHRGVDTREAIQAKCARHPRYLHPEGTRRANKPNAMEPDALRAGGLKNCYESRTPAIIVITDGKERIWNEKTGRCSFRTVLYRARHAPIRPADHESFDTFFAAVEKAWIATWRRAYAMRAERERAAPPSRGAAATTSRNTKPVTPTTATSSQSGRKLCLSPARIEWITSTTPLAPISSVEPPMTAAISSVMIDSFFNRRIAACTTSWPTTVPHSPTPKSVMA